MTDYLPIAAVGRRPTPEAVRITVQHLRDLLADTSESPALHVVEQQAGPGLEIGPEAYSHHDYIVVTRDDLVGFLGDEGGDDDLADYLPLAMQQVDVILDRVDRIEHG